MRFKIMCNARFCMDSKCMDYKHYDDHTIMFSELLLDTQVYIRVSCLR